MRVLFLVNHYPPDVCGGAEIVTAELACGLLQQGHEVLVVTLDRHVGAPRWSAPLLANGVPVMRIPTPTVYSPLRRPRHRGTRLLWFLLDVWNPVARAIPAMVHAHWPWDVAVTGNLWGLSTSVWAQLSKFGPVAHFAHDGALVCATGFMRHGEHVCRGQLLPCSWLLKARRLQTASVDTVITPSNFLRAVIQEAGLFPASEWHVVRPSAPIAPASDVVWSPLVGRLRLVFAGGSSPHKGLSVLFDAMLAEPRAELECFGSLSASDVPDALRQRVAVRGQASRSAVVQAIASSDFLVVPSRCDENLPTVIVEAISVGTPTIASRVGGIPELVVNGGNGLLFEEGDSAGLAELLSQYADSSSEYMRLRAGVATGATPLAGEDFDSIIRTLAASASRQAAASEKVNSRHR